MAGKDGVTRSALNRKVRQEALRDQLSAQGHVQHVIDIVEEVNNLNNPMENIDLQRKKVVIDTKLKLINKYLPDVKQQEVIDSTDVDKAMDKLTDAELEAIASGK
jgi:hypothetical protein